jgi:hypothetical protein
MDQDLKVFRDLVLWLWDNHKEPGHYPNPKARKIYEDIERAYRSILNREDLESILPTEDDVRSGFSPVNRYLYLNPIFKDALMIPVLKISTDFGRHVPEIRIRLGLFVHKGGTTHAFGYRFESPEGQGIHHYYHAQFIHGFEKEQPFMPKNIWLPDGCPTFPLDADNPVKLLLSLLVALYGLPSLGQIRASVPEIEEHLSQMCCPSFKEFEYYWIATMRRDGQQYYISTVVEPGLFEKEFRQVYQGCDLKQIPRGKYGEQKRQHRWHDKQLQSLSTTGSRRDRTNRA